MEAYSTNMILISYAGLCTSIITGILYAVHKKTLKYIWLFGCMAGFCVTTVLAHVSYSLAYGDPTAPNYEAYKDWNIYRYMLSDVVRLTIWWGIGILNYLAFIKKNKIAKYLFIVGAALFPIFMVLLMVLFSVSAIRIN